MKNIFAIIVTFNGQNYIRHSIESLVRQNIRIKIVIIDNASNDNTVSIIRECPQVVKIFCLKKNIGFGQANNIGMRYCHENGADHILLINQDAYIKPDCLKKLVQLQKDYPQYAVLSPIHLNETGTHLDLHFAEFVSRSNSKDVLLSDLILKKKLKKIYKVDYVNAAIWLLSRQCIEKVGLFNPAFFHYGEDLNYLDRLKFKGFQIGIVPTVFGVHRREQFSFTGNAVDFEKYVVMMKAVIVHKLSLLTRSIWLNLVSVIYQITVQMVNCKYSHYKKLRLLSQLTGFLMVNLIKIILYRAISKDDMRPFWDFNTEKIIVL